MRLSLLVNREGANEVLPDFVDQQLQHGEGQGWDSIMHEDVISESEGHIERLEIGHCDNQHDFCGEGEEHEGIGDTLCDD